MPGSLSQGSRIHKKASTQCRCINTDWRPVIHFTVPVPVVNAPQTRVHATPRAQGDSKSSCAQQHHPDCNEGVVDGYMVVWCLVMVRVYCFAEPVYVSMKQVLVYRPLLNSPDRHA